MSFFFDIETLLQPIPGDEPCGVSLLHDPALEAIKAARREDDPSLPQGVWQTELKIADWAAVEARCVDLLTRKSKDLMVAAWLAEAWLRQCGWDALPAGVGLITSLCERYWDTLHPLPSDGDWEYRAAPIAWIAGQFPGLLAGRIGLCEGGDIGAITLAQYESAQRAAIALAERKDVPAARREEAKREADAMTAAVCKASPEALQVRLRAIDTALEISLRFDAWLTSSLECDAPSFHALVDVSGRARHQIMEWLQMHPGWQDMNRPNNAIDSTSAADLTTSGTVEGRIPQMATRLQSRELAYQQLAIIGEFLLQYEPHSPVPYMIQRALEWGAMPLPELLRQLTEEGRGRALGVALGLLPQEG
ncbi:MULTISPECIES: type VI secretion system protein TssA [unclassified Paraburkholderia]|uniref:type VI secretion system protein TssA n=1 Tax=unclassified Paraburkholderia TaxID=2615204 RepID=UPI002AAF7064|nr:MULTISPECIES: type VI secretion system protein TssA [unclassified Paraburkholderia]